jgi:hypothetical protein
MKLELFLGLKAAKAAGLRVTPGEFPGMIGQEN